MGVVRKLRHFARGRVWRYSIRTFIHLLSSQISFQSQFFSVVDVFRNLPSKKPPPSPVTHTQTEFFSITELVECTMNT